MAEQTPIPEPPDGAYILLGGPPLQVLLIRDDASAALTRDVVPDLPEEYRWWPADSGDGNPLCWSMIVGPDPDPMDGLPRGLNRNVLCRLFTQAELDQAVDDAQVQVVGDHLKELGGWCRSCGVHHSEVEWARIHDQLQREEEERRTREGGES